LETLDIRMPVYPGTVAHRDLDHLQVLFDGAENQVKIAKEIKLAEIGSVGGYNLIVFTQHHLGAAEGIPEALIEQPCEKQAEKFIAQMV